MALSQDLLEQARQLAEQGAGRPKQVDLRRAISSAYYSLFHLLLDDIEETFAPALRRTIKHTHMLGACEATANEVQRQVHDRSGTPAKTPVPLRQVQLSLDLHLVAKTFSNLQQARHEADYDTRTTFNRHTARSHVRECERAHAAWAHIRKRVEARAFLTMLVVDFGKLKDH